MTVAYKLKEHLDTLHKIENVSHITFDSTFVWIYQIGEQGGPAPIRVKLVRIHYLKADKVIMSGG